MRILLDENVPYDLVAELTALGHDVLHFGDSSESGAPDPDLFAIVQRERRLIVSQDVGFADARKLELQLHFGFVLVRLEQDEATIIDRVREVFRSEDVDSWRGCIVVIDEDRVRVRRPRL